MPDEIDLANDRAEAFVEDAIREVRRKQLDPGEPGDCEMCGDWSPRLVGGACARCRDHWRLS